MDHVETPRLERALSKLLPGAGAYQGVVYRSASPRYANLNDLLTGVGARLVGGRWNPPRSFAAVYLSLDPHSALDEVLAHFRHYALPVESAMPRVLVAVSANLRRVLDLADGAVQKAIGVSRRRLVSEPWRQIQATGEEALTQAIGRIGHDRGLEGLLVPSAARPGGKNLIVFPANLDLGSRLTILNAGELPLMTS